VFDNLNDSNILLYAIKCYRTPNCIMEEFEEDYKRIKYINRLIKKYAETGELKERLILNHIIVLGNVFGVEATTRLLFYRVPKEYYKILKTFLLFLNYMPDVVRGIKEEDIKSSDITIDFNIAKNLRTLHNIPSETATPGQ